MKTPPNKPLRQRLLRLFVSGLVLLIATSTLAQTTKWRFIAVGDTRGASSADPVNSTILGELTDQIVSQQAEFVIVPGDLVYSGSLANFQIWTNAMSKVYQAGIGVYPVLGNHDATDATSFRQVIGQHLPDNGPAGEVNRTYAFSCANVLVLALDTYVNPGRVNQSWVDSVLAANTFPHVFAFGHMPAFKANHADCLDDYSAERDAFWTSLRNAGARVYFCGHDHFYDHMRVYDGDGNADNDVHQLIVGGGGAPLYTSYAYDGVNSVWAPGNVFHENQYGYTLVEVDGLTITLTAYHRTGPNAYAPSGDAWTYTVPGSTPLQAPTGLTALPGNAQVSLSWNPSAGADSYNLKRATSSSGPYATAASGLTSTAYIDTGLNNGTTYYYVVTAVNAAGESVPSAYVGATPQAVAPPPAPILTAGGGKRTITLTWTPAKGATSFTVKRAATSAGPFVELATGLTTRKYTDRRLSAGATYYYVVTAINSAGESASNVAWATAK